MEVIILAGGFGTRLNHIVTDVPKPMAPVNGQPFLKHMFDYLLKMGVTRVILAVGYKSEIIETFFGYMYQGIKITYSIEDRPLGTGGAIKKALRLCKNEDVFIINGDTYFDLDLNEMKDFHTDNNADLTLAVKCLEDFDRYGSVIIEHNIIMEFKEKKATARGKINGGTYILNKRVFDSIEQESFSFEKDILEVSNFDIYAFESEGYFIDIGVPEDYYKVQRDFATK